ncbi:hypothetical protein BXZ70DRAFT_906508 [Cristinia sonorae]|uniref:Uncharacterized protein n=1 Tax=Cristinia sonorae TaxID=1940300 RepID=A0A8K0URU3_9AGAR|nr:hypothetical protein BXZ70DRAFT_906508 [Cristinia sonorae]
MAAASTLGKKPESGALGDKNEDIKGLKNVLLRANNSVFKVYQGVFSLWLTSSIAMILPSESAEYADGFPAIRLLTLPRISQDFCLLSATVHQGLKYNIGHIRDEVIRRFKQCLLEGLDNSIYDPPLHPELIHNPEKEEQPSDTSRDCPLIYMRLIFAVISLALAHNLPFLFPPAFYAAEYRGEFIATPSLQNERKGKSTWRDASEGGSCFGLRFRGASMASIPLPPHVKHRKGCEAVTQVNLGEVWAQQLHKCDILLANGRLDTESPGTYCKLCTRCQERLRRRTYQGVGRGSRLAQPTPSNDRQAVCHSTNGV